MKKITFKLLIILVLGVILSSNVVFAMSSFKLDASDMDILMDLCDKEDLQIVVVPALNFDDSKEIRADLFLQNEKGISRAYLNRKDLCVLNGKEQKGLLCDFVSEMSSSSMSLTGQRKVYDGMKSAIDPVLANALPKLLEDSKPNIFKALRIMAPFTSTTGVILGVIIILLIIGLILSTLIDLFYMTIPSLQMLDDNTSKIKRGFSKFVSPTAIYALKESVEGSELKQVCVIYFKKRFMAYIILFVCIVYLLSSKIADLVVWLYEIADGIIKTF